MLSESKPTTLHGLLYVMKMWIRWPLIQPTTCRRRTVWISQLCLETLIGFACHVGERSLGNSVWPSDPTKCTHHSLHLWDVITCLYPCYLPLAHKSPYVSLQCIDITVTYLAYERLPIAQDLAMKQYHLITPCYCNIQQMRWYLLTLLFQFWIKILIFRYFSVLNLMGFPIHPIWHMPCGLLSTVCHKTMAF